MASMDKKGVDKSRDGVPVWNGDSSTFQEFEEAALLWEQSVAHHKRYLCAPRLVAELQGTARRFVLGKRPDWVSYNGGVVRLLSHLRSSLGLPQLPELTDHLTRFFKLGKRKRGETMNDYITRKTETYVRACQALGRVMKAYTVPPTSLTSSSTRTNYGSWSYQEPSAPSVSASGDQGEDTFQDVPDEQGEHEDPWARSTDQDWWGNRGWQQDDAWSGWQSDPWSRSTWRDYPEEAPWHAQAPELLPDMIQGWYLLNDAGLDPGEKNMILAAIKQDFSFSRISQELRHQWPDEDLRRRDQNGRHSSWMADMDPSSDEEAMVCLSSDDLNEEGQALMMEAQEEAAQAWAAVQQGRRTLREARDKQHQARMSRKYFRTSFKTKSDTRSSTATTPSRSTCFKCGGDHKTHLCPKPASQSAAIAAAEQSAPFICYVEENLDALHGGYVAEETGDHVFTAAPAPSTADVVAQGKAVLDGGATRTLGSVHALERILELNKQARGENGLNQLDLQDRPTFGFGNSTRNQCVSTAALKIQADGREGQVKIHALDDGEGPVLFSIASMRSLGAILDFENDLLVFRKLSDTKVIPLERSNTGHQLLPMTRDWYEGAISTAKPVPDLKSFI